MRATQLEQTVFCTTGYRFCCDWTLIGGTTTETALVSATHPFPGTDNRDRAESAAGYRGWIMGNSLIYKWLPHSPLYAVESRVWVRLPSVSGSDGGLPRDDGGLLSRATYDLMAKQTPGRPDQGLRGRK